MKSAAAIMQMRLARATVAQRSTSSAFARCQIAFTMRGRRKLRGRQTIFVIERLPICPAKHGARDHDCRSRLPAQKTLSRISCNLSLTANQTREIRWRQPRPECPDPSARARVSIISGNADSACGLILTMRPLQQNLPARLAGALAQSRSTRCALGCHPPDNVVKSISEIALAQPCGLVHIFFTLRRPDRPWHIDAPLLKVLTATR